jgi:hypothetical protein
VTKTLINHMKLADAGDEEGMAKYYSFVEE